MKFAITADQRQYFHQHQLLELEGLLSGSQIKHLTSAIEASVFKKKDTPGVKYINLPVDELFMAGYDVWRTDPAIAKIVTDVKYAEIAGELTHSRILRLGYDQWFPANPVEPRKKSADSLYYKMLSKTASLRNVCCLQGVRCGIMLCLSDSNIASDTPYEGVFSHTAGNGVFIAPERGIDFTTLLNRPGQQFLLIVYTEKTTLYTMQEGDPHVHELKRLGYVFGDRLNDRLNPIIYR
ncbi:MAG: hypothetical protein H0U49_02215 [Parachlamydiaceae bacterium]|nr:hypothetical protein [Parachlamydiaceae bacterium]